MEMFFTAHIRNYGFDELCDEIQSVWKEKEETVDKIYLKDDTNLL